MLIDNLEIRSANAADVPAIARIYSDAIINGVATFELEPPGDAEMLQRYKATITGGFPYLVAIQNNKILGYTYASAFRPRPAYRWSVENSVYIAPEAQRSGIGRALLSQLIEACEAKGFRQMLAVIGGSDHQSPIQLHTSLGFEKVGQIKNVGWKHAKWHDSVVMQRSLGEGDDIPPE